VHWEHHPAHFWLVLGVSLVSVVLGALTSEAATRRSDARTFLVSLAFLASAGFLGLHALATPGVLLENRNTGFVIATPVGLALAAVFAVLSSFDLSAETAAAILRRKHHRRRAAPVLLGVTAGDEPRLPASDSRPAGPGGDRGQRTFVAISVHAHAKPLGDLEVKGKAEPVAAYVLTGLG
jgi:hypothetical protein